MFRGDIPWPSKEPKRFGYRLLAFIFFDGREAQWRSLRTFSKGGSKVCFCLRVAALQSRSRRATNLRVPPGRVVSHQVCCTCGYIDTPFIWRLWYLRTPIIHSAMTKWRGSKWSERIWSTWYAISPQDAIKLIPGASNLGPPPEPRMVRGT